MQLLVVDEGDISLEHETPSENILVGGGYEASWIIGKSSDLF